MEKGSVYRAKNQTKWAGLILLVIPMITSLVLDQKGIVGLNFLGLFCSIGIVWSLVIYSIVVKQIWKKIRRRHLDIIVNKIVNYHFLCIKSISESDWKQVSFLLEKVLKVYDPSSPVTYFIKGAYTVGISDIKGLGVLAEEIEKAKNECINRV